MMERQIQEKWVIVQNNQTSSTVEAFKIQLNLSNTHTEGTEQSVCITGVSVL